MRLITDIVLEKNSTSFKELVAESKTFLWNTMIELVLYHLMHTKSWIILFTTETAVRLWSMEDHFGIFIIWSLNICGWEPDKKSDQLCCVLLRADYENSVHIVIIVHFLHIQKYQAFDCWTHLGQIYICCTRWCSRFKRKIEFDRCKWSFIYQSKYI